MATTIQLLRSDIAQTRPEPNVLANGTPMVNLHESEPGLFFTARDGSLFKVGPTSVGPLPPNSFPQGEPGNSAGELWLDTSGANQVLRVYDGTAWVACIEDVGGTVTSVGLTMPAPFTVAGSPVTTSGTFAVTLNTQTANRVFAGPVSGGVAAPTFRVLAAADIPTALDSHTFIGITPDADVTRNLGSPSLRWANIYSADLNLSNKGGSNSVDGTWGSYTIQEGEDDLYLINRRSGKRYKFLLQEV
jgi:hypothetical protein